MTRRRTQRTRNRRGVVDFFGVPEVAIMWVAKLDPKTALSLRRVSRVGRDLVDDVFDMAELRRSFQRRALFLKLRRVFRKTMNLMVIRPTAHMGESHTHVAECYRTHTSSSSDWMVSHSWQIMDPSYVPRWPCIGERTEAERYPVLTAEAAANGLTPPERRHAGMLNGFYGSLILGDIDAAFVRLVWILEQPGTYVQFNYQSVPQSLREPLDPAVRLCAQDPLGLVQLKANYPAGCDWEDEDRIPGQLLIDWFSIHLRMCSAYGQPCRFSPSAILQVS
jgi:hypothetical protein